MIPGVLFSWIETCKLAKAKKHSFTSFTVTLRDSRLVEKEWLDQIETWFDAADTGYRVLKIWQTPDKVTGNTVVRVSFKAKGKKREFNIVWTN